MAVGKELSVKRVLRQFDAVDSDVNILLARIDGQRNGCAEVPLLGNVLVEVVRTTFGPVLGIVELIVNFTTIVDRPPAPTRIVLVTMGNELFHSLRLDEVYRGTCSLAVHEVTHEDAALVDEHRPYLFVLHHVLEEARGGFCAGPVVIWMVVGVVEQVDGVVVVLTAIEPQSEVSILQNDAESLGQT